LTGQLAPGEAGSTDDPNRVSALRAYRERPEEKARLASLLRLLPVGGRILEIGARDGHMSLALAQRFDRVIAVDVREVPISHPRIESVAGDVRALDFPDRSFEAVLCAEVLEHIAPADLDAACRELARVCAGMLLVGVPYRQDLRVGRTTCQSCGRSNPPWGHVNRFDERRLDGLFTGLTRVGTDWVGRSDETTNPLSALLMDWAGNPWGTYVQEEPCVHCGSSVGRPSPPGLSSRMLCALAERVNRLQRHFSPSRAAWIHCLYRGNVAESRGAAADVPLPSVS
jgi:SAM-dependent methyltransferase